MKKVCLLVASMLLSLPCLALGKKEVRQIIETAYPGARITEIEREEYRGQKVFEVDFKHAGESLEAIISLEGEIIKVHIDD